MPAKKHVLVLGAGAAGSSAAQVLAQHEDIATTAIAATETAPYNRTLVNKAVATGLIDAKQAHLPLTRVDRKSTRLNSSHVAISYAVFCLKKKKHHAQHAPNSGRRLRLILRHS